ncbi:MAG: hypothetical protein COT81_00740 [Candidatus Buchananbacteria bacterium CG10_big_fil_rev_8_21_14_0_10_42_9]|uniref:SD-repeat containing protein B domain-containing protein n=1 Tax=Candidatus Buchananbacteria bacterium CG10_big_fil_rev_8_21_14_0_10_42_9 TaxID=1974526 RepID=A0A2H0W2G2_9BACT|nr:MAG: hypothetical protein COT81_00740 [Candidatus Buchananbacteria bacterium CG10_big_fil_rev_8_21_14_0_10_42_9]
MRKITLFLVALSLILAPYSYVGALTDLENLQTDSLIKVEGRETVYYYAADGKRYVFPNNKIFQSWFDNFDSVVEVSLETLQSIPLGGNVRYRPGIVLVKIQSDPKVYSIGPNGALHWLVNENAAVRHFGRDWSKLVDDIPDVFFIHYHRGSDVGEDDDYDPDEDAEGVPTINDNRGIGKTIRALRSHTKRCKIVRKVVEEIDEESGEVLSRKVEVERECRPLEDLDIFDGKKLKICHFPGGDESKGVTLSISTNAWPAHERHGDTLGVCGRDDDDGDDDAEISGSKFNDLNGNGVWNDGEQGLSGWTIKLTKGSSTISALTDSEGKYKFQDLAPGIYTVAEEQKSGWTQTKPTSTTYIVDVEANEEYEDLDFGNQQDESSTTTPGAIVNEDVNAVEESIVLSGTTGVTVKSVKISAELEDVVLDEISVYVEDANQTGTADGNYKDIGNVTIYHGASKLTEGNIPSTNKVTFPFSNNPADTNYLKIVKGTSETLTLKIDTAEISAAGTDNPGTPNASFRVGFGGSDGIIGTGVDSGLEVSSTFNSPTSTVKILHSAKPIVTLPTTSNRLGAASNLTSGDIRLFGFEVTADSSQGRPVMLYRTSFNVTTSDGVDISNLYLRQDGEADKVSDADAISLDDIGTQGGRVSFTFNSPNFNNGDSKEYLEVTDGTTKRFYLHGTVSGVAAGDFVSVSLLGDLAEAIGNDTGVAADTWQESTNGKFVWSDDHKNISGSADATGEQIWFNGHLVDGLEKTVTTTAYTISL